MDGASPHASCLSCLAARAGARLCTSQPTEALQLRSFAARLRSEPRSRKPPAHPPLRLSAAAAAVAARYDERVDEIETSSVCLSHTSPKEQGVGQRRRLLFFPFVIATLSVAATFSPITSSGARQRACLFFSAFSSISSGSWFARQEGGEREKGISSCSGSQSLSGLSRKGSKQTSRDLTIQCKASSFLIRVLVFVLVLRPTHRSLLASSHTLVRAAASSSIYTISPPSGSQTPALLKTRSAAAVALSPISAVSSVRRRVPGSIKLERLLRTLVVPDSAPSPSLVGDRYRIALIAHPHRRIEAPLCLLNSSKGHLVSSSRRIILRSPLHLPLLSIVRPFLYPPKAAGPPSTD